MAKEAPERNLRSLHNRTWQCQAGFFLGGDGKGGTGAKLTKPTQPYMAMSSWFLPRRRWQRRHQSETYEAYTTVHGNVKLVSSSAAMAKEAPERNLRSLHNRTWQCQAGFFLGGDGKGGTR